MSSVRLLNSSDEGVPKLKVKSNSESHMLQLEAMSVVIERLKEEKYTKRDSKSLHQLVEMDNLSINTQEDSKKKDNRKKLFSLKRRKSSASSSALKKEELKPATSFISGLIGRDMDRESFEILRNQLQSTKTETPWYDLFLRLDGIDSIFQYLYPYQRCAQPDQEELYLLALQCIFFALKNERLKKDLFNNISKLKDIEVPETSNEYSSISNSENNNVSTGGGSKVPIKQRTHSSTNLLNQPVRVTRVTSSVNTANMLKQGIRLSNLQILISLYAFITSEIPVPGLILTLVHILTNICQQFNGTEMFLAELNRVQRVNKRGGFLGNFSLAQSLSEESLRLALRGNSSQINQECLYLLPLLSPLKQIDASYLAHCWTLLNTFIIYFKDIKMRFLIQNTALQLGILPTILETKKRLDKEPDSALETQLEVFQQCIEDDYGEMSRTLSPGELIKFSLFRESSGSRNCFRVSLPYIQRTVVSIPFNEDTTIDEILKRTIIKQQYLQGDDVSNLIAMNLSDFGLYVQQTLDSNQPSAPNPSNEPLTATGEPLTKEGSNELGYWLENTSKTAKDYNLSGEVISRMDLIPWEILMDITNITTELYDVPFSPESIKQSNNKRTIITKFIIPNQPIHLTLKQLQEKYCTSNQILQVNESKEAEQEKANEEESMTLSAKCKQQQVEYGLYWKQSNCWLDQGQKWTSYPLFKDKVLREKNLLLMTIRYKPLQIKYEHRFCEYEIFKINVTVKEIIEELTSKLNISNKTASDFGLFLFPNTLNKDTSPLSRDQIGWEAEEAAPGTYLLSNEQRLSNIFEKYPKRNFLLRYSLKPKFVSVDIFAKEVSTREEFLIYFSVPVKDLIQFFCDKVSIQTHNKSLALAIKNKNGEYKILRRSISLKDQGVDSEQVLYLRDDFEFISDDPFDDEANIWDIKITSDSIIITGKLAVCASAPVLGGGSKEMTTTSRVHSSPLGDEEDIAIPENTIGLPSIGNNREIKAGTLNILVQYLTSEKDYNSDFMNTFLATYQSFTTSELLLQKLIERFFAPANIPADVVRIVQQKVCVVIKYWISKALPLLSLEEEVKKNVFLEKIVEFSENALKTEPSAAAIKKIIVKNKNEVPKADNDFKTSFKYTSYPPVLLYSPGDCISVVNLNPIELARQLTLISFNFFRKIKFSELFGQPWSKQSLHHRCPNLMNNISFFNKITVWVMKSILSSTNINERSEVYLRFIQIAQTCREFGNFNVVTAIVSGINSSSIGRLHWTKAKVPKKYLQIFSQLEPLASMSGSFKEYRATVANHSVPIVPYLGVYLSDLTFIDDGNPDIVKGLINFHKRSMMYKVLKQIELYQQTPYNFTPVYEIQDWIMNAEMVDEDTLYELSLKVEPRNAPRSDIQ